MFDQSCLRRAAGQPSFPVSDPKHHCIPTLEERDLQRPTHSLHFFIPCRRSQRNPRYRCRSSWWLRSGLASRRCRTLRRPVRVSILPRHPGTGPKRKRKYVDITNGSNIILALTVIKLMDGRRSSRTFSPTSQVPYSRSMSAQQLAQVTGALAHLTLPNTSDQSNTQAQTCGHNASITRALFPGLSRVSMSSSRATSACNKAA